MKVGRYFRRMRLSAFGYRLPADCCPLKTKRLRPPEDERHSSAVPPQFAAGGLRTHPGTCLAAASRLRCNGLTRAVLHLRGQFLRQSDRATFGGRFLEAACSPWQPLSGSSVPAYSSRRRVFGCSQIIHIFGRRVKKEFCPAKIRAELLWFCSSQEGVTRLRPRICPRLRRCPRRRRPRRPRRR